MSADISSVREGDEVTVTVKGTVTWVSGPDPYTYIDIGSTVILQENVVSWEKVPEPLKVGDEVTLDNVKALPKGRCIIIDRDLDTYHGEPEGNDLIKYGPFKLIYVHPEGDA